MDPITIAAIIGGVASLGSAGISALSSKKANKNAADAQDAAFKKQEEMYNSQLAQNEKWYKERMNENYLESAEAQAAIAKARDMANEQIASERARQAVMGGTGVGISAARRSANQMLGDTMSNIAATGAARKDAAEQQYLATNNQLTQQLINAYGQRGSNQAAQYQNQASQNAAAGSAALGMLGNIGSSYISAYQGKPKTTPTP